MSDVWMMSAGLPAVVVVAFALVKSPHILHRAAWILAGVTAVSPLAIGYVWRWFAPAGLAYGLLTYLAAFGFAVRLVDDRLSFKYHGILALLWASSALAAFVAIPMLVVPALGTPTLVSENTDVSDEKLRQSLDHIDGALKDMEGERHRLQMGMDGLIRGLRERAEELHALERERQRVRVDIQLASAMKGMNDEQFIFIRDKLKSAQHTDYFMAFWIGVASSFTVNLGWKFFAGRS